MLRVPAVGKVVGSAAALLDWIGSLLPAEMLIPLLDATAVNITHGINILLTSLICGSEATTPPLFFFF